MCGHEDMNEDGCPGMKVAPRREAGIYLAAIKAPPVFPQQAAPSSHQLPKANDRPSYLFSQFIPLDKGFLLPQLQMPCMWDRLLLLLRGIHSILSCVHRNHCHILVLQTHDVLQCHDLEIVSHRIAQQHPAKSQCCWLSCHALPSVIEKLPPFPDFPMLSPSMAGSGVCHDRLPGGTATLGTL